MIFNPQRQISSINSTYTPLNSGQSFVSAGEIVPMQFACVSIAISTDVDCTYYVDFSSDGVNWDSSLQFKYYSSYTEAPKKLNVYRSYCRVRVVNDSASNQTYLRLQVTYGNFNTTTSSLGGIVNQDADTIITRSSFDKKAITLGLFENTSMVTKAGLNDDIDTGSVPEDIWGGGGVYNGFPSSGETVRAVSTSADDAAGGSGLRTMSAQLMTTDWVWVSVTFTLNGTTPVAPDAPYTNTLFIRGHTASGLTAGSTGANVGDISIYQSTTTANVFLLMLIGRNQTNNSAYTIPAGYSGLLTNVTPSIAQSTAAAFAQGHLRIRNFGGIFRQRRPLLILSTSSIEDLNDEYLLLTEKTDIIGRITSVSNSNTIASLKYFIYIFKNT